MMVIGGPRAATRMMAAHPKPHFTSPLTSLIDQSIDCHEIRLGLLELLALPAHGTVGPEPPTHLVLPLGGEQGEDGSDVCALHLDHDVIKALIVHLDAPFHKLAYRLLHAGQRGFQ